MDVLNISEEQKDHIFRIVSGILHLGNAEFSETKDDEGGSVIEGHCKESFEAAAKMLGLNANDLLNIICHKKMIDPFTKKPIMKKQSQQQAEYNRDSMSKALYGRLFDWLVHKINQALHKPYNKVQDGTLGVIGLLDIFGFEIF